MADLLKQKLVARYRRTCSASKSMRKLFLFLGAGVGLIELVKAVQTPSINGTLFELLSAMIAAGSGCFINQWPDAEQAVLAFKLAFFISLIQLATFATHLNGDIMLPNNSWPLGCFFFVVSWGLDRTLKVIAELGEVMEDAQRKTTSGKKSKRKNEQKRITKETGEQPLIPESKKDREFGSAIYA
eukprot:jgi/Bigna1/89851/estExt_fgenesh1_pg.C_560123